MGIACCASENEADLTVLQKTTSLEKHGYYVASLPWGYRSSTLRFIKKTELEKGRPPYIIEIAQVMKRDSYFPVPNSMIVCIAIFDLYRNDEILCDRELTRASVNPEVQSTPVNQTEFELFSDRYVRMFSKYVLANRLILRPGPQTPVVNFS